MGYSITIATHQEPPRIAPKGWNELLTICNIFGRLYKMAVVYIICNRTSTLYHFSEVKSDPHFIWLKR